ncbi:MAG TPA: lysozyme inhibitor LprI family protein [Gaiellaceae bacterium]|nr:lysozyme inhibitor LprI family protein [Gaiellaceae bacterium]
MRIALALVLLAVLKPPVIHEPFTPLPCPMHPQSTLDTEGCLEQAILKGDRKIDTKAKAIFVKLRPDARAGFVRGERSWLAYRRATCLAEASTYAGGTLTGVVDASCTVSRNTTHLRDLSDLLKNLQSP